MRFLTRGLVRRVVGTSTRRMCFVIRERRTRKINLRPPRARLTRRRERPSGFRKSAKKAINTTRLKARRYIVVVVIIAVLKIYTSPTPT